MEGRLPIKVYYEDTDCLGVVYHASYLRFFERGRTELIGQLGVSIGELNARGIVFAVYKIQVTFRKAAKLGDQCDVVTHFGPRVSEYRLEMRQQLMRDGERVCDAKVQLVCLDGNLAVRAFPADVLAYCPPK